MPSVAARTVLSLAALALSACGEGPAPLDGSLTAICDVDYTRTELVLADDSLAVRFLRPRGTGEDVVVKLSATLIGWELSTKDQLNLAEPLPTGGQRGRVSRQGWEDPHEQFPRLSRGMLSLREDPRTAAVVHGEFTVSFAQGSEFGAGRALFGEFEAEVKR